MIESISPCFELLVMSSHEIIENCHRAETESEINEMILKVCYESRNNSISNAEFRRMISKLVSRKIDIIQANMPDIRI